MKVRYMQHLISAKDNQHRVSAWKIWLVGALAFGLLDFVWLCWQPLPRHISCKINDIIDMLVACSSVLCALQGAKYRSREQLVSANRCSFSQRCAPGMITSSIVSYGLGCVVLAYYELVENRQAPFPSIADIFFSLYPILMLIGMIMLPSQRVSADFRRRVVLDSMMMMTAIVTLVWYFLLGPLLMQGTHGSYGKFVGVIFPTIDLVTLLCIIFLTLHPAEVKMRFARYLFIYGMVCSLIADLVFCRMALSGTYITGQPSDVGWIISNLLLGVGVAAYRQEAKLLSCNEKMDSELITDNSVSFPVLWHLLLPYALVPVMLGLLVYAMVHHGGREYLAGVAIGSSILILLILLRQILAILENKSLYTRLRQAYTELSQKSEQADLYTLNLEQMNKRLSVLQQEALERNHALAEANSRLERLATCDGMTGLPNHRVFHERLHLELARGNRTGEQLAVLVCDVDKFKHFNDTFGHPAGDEALILVARILQENLREVDLAARYGGEEFAILLPSTDLAAAKITAERLRNAIASYQFPNRQVTISIGLTHESLAGDKAEELIASADRALYAAKQAGRNCVIVSGHEIYALKPPSHGTVNARNTVNEGQISLQPIVVQMEQLLQEPMALTLSGLLTVIDVRNCETEGHSQRVGWDALRLAKELMQLELLHLTPMDLRELSFGALLHDIGKIELPDTILSDSRALSSEEMNLIRRHPLSGVELVKPFIELSCAIPVIRSHHERWDGQGYPDRLVGEAIPISARIVALADALDAMTTGRCYRAPMSYQKMRAEILAGTATQFDPDVVKAFLSVPEADWAPNHSVFSTDQSLAHGDLFDQAFAA